MRGARRLERILPLNTLEDLLAGVSQVDLDKVRRRQAGHDPDVCEGTGAEVDFLVDSNVFGRGAAREVLKEQKVTRDAFQKKANVAEMVTQSRILHGEDETPPAPRSRTCGTSMRWAKAGASVQITSSMFTLAACSPR